MMRRIAAVLSVLCLCISARAQLDVRVNSFIQDELRRGAPFYDLGSVIRFVPSTMHMGLGLAGVPARHALLDRTVEATMAHAISISAGYILKYAVSRERPDLSDMRSFPSGHSILAFTGAELTRIEYGWGWGSGSYALALFTGGERLWGNKHWITDVLAGAGIGILSAQAGALLLGPVKRLFNLPDSNWDGPWGRKASVALAPVADPFSGTFAATLALEF